MPEIDPKDFPSNSIYPAKRQIENSPEEKNVRNKIVVHGKVRRRKKSFMQNLGAIFTGESAKSVGNYILWDVLIPAAKSTLDEAIRTATGMVLYGSDERPDSRLRRNRDRTSYESFYGNGSGRNRERTKYERPERREASRGRPSRDSSDIIFDERRDAEQVLTTLLEAIDQYDVVTVSEFYVAAGILNDFTSEKYGWDNLAGAEIRRVRDGWVLDLPQPILLD